MNKGNKLSTLILIACCASFSLLIPHLLVNLGVYIKLRNQTQILKIEIVKKQEALNNLPQTSTFIHEQQTKDKELESLNKEYKEYKIMKKLICIWSMIQTFFIWFVITIATRLFNDRFYPILEKCLLFQWQKVFGSKE